MSARTGPRALGTDGSDFRHRERVAAHYRTSVTNKFRLKLVLTCHILLFILMLVRLLEDVLDAFDLDFMPLERLNPPSPKPWEYIWAFSIIAVIVAFVSLPKNRASVLRYAYYGLFSFGLLPILWGTGTDLPILYNLLRNPDYQDAETFRGFPIVVLHFIFFVIAAQVHLFSMYVMNQLIQAWSPKETRVMAKESGNSISSSKAKLFGSNAAIHPDDKKAQ